jgi:asparagine synthase (glutamine-hydrolysing)
MCGIAGICGPEASGGQARLQGMLAAIAHRGRDHRGVWTDGPCLLGHNRLSIIDLTETGHEPIPNEDETVWALLNGEIYNYRELRTDLITRGHRFRGTGDAEVIPHLYEEYGRDFLRHLRGMFAIVIWDARAGTMLLARDRSGKKPLYYARIDGSLVFASEIKALLTHPGVEDEVDPQAIHDYLSFGIVPGERTVYRGIRRLPAAHVLTVDGKSGETRLDRYWDAAYLPKHKIGFDEAVEEVDRILRESVALRLRADVPVGCFLSGGIDSGLVTAMAAQVSDQPVRTYSIGVADPAMDERPLARLVSERYGTDHTEFLLTHELGDNLERVIGHYDEPFADASALPSFAVAALAADHVRVVLNGDGGDEIFAGYRHFLAGRAADRVGFLAGTPARTALALLPAPRTGRTRYQFLYRFLHVLAASPEERYLALTFDGLTERQKAAAYGATKSDLLPSHRHVSAIDTAGLGPVDRLLRQDFHLLLADDHLVKMDMATMAHTLEGRSPFLDHELVEFVARLPENVKLPGRTTKPILRKLAERYLPAELIGAPKRGFEVPLAQWMERDLNPMLRARVLDSASFSNQIFDKAWLESFMAGTGWDRHRWSRMAWSLLCMEIWWTARRDRHAAGVPTEPVPIRAARA